MINNVTLVGRITKDLEIRKTASGTSVVSFNLAVERNFKDASGEKQTDFIGCVAYRNTAEILGKYAHKGDMVGLNGSIQTRTYEGKNGTVYVTEVICNEVQLLGGKREKPEPIDTRRATESYSDPDSLFANTPSMDIESSDLPFY